MSDAEDENRHPMDITPQQVMERAVAEVAGGKVRAAICILVYEKDELTFEGGGSARSEIAVLCGGIESEFELVGVLEIGKTNIVLSGMEEE